MLALSISGIAISFFLLSTILGKRKKSYSDKLLVLFLAVSFLEQGYLYIENSGLLEHSYWMLLGKGFPLLSVALMFIYVYSLTHSEKVPQTTIFISLMPAITYSAHFLFFYLFVFETIDVEIKNGLLFTNGELSLSWLMMVILLLLASPLFIVWFFRAFRTYRKNLLAQVSNTDKINLNWLKFLFTAWVVVSAILVPTGAMAVTKLWISIDAHQAMTQYSYVLFLFLFGYFGLNQTTVFSNLELAEKESREPKASYEKSGLTPEKMSQYHKHLIDLMESKKPYLDGSLDAVSLAGMAGISVNHLSQVLSQQQKQNFFDFVNSYRVSEVQKKLADKKNKNLTLLAIALESGFNSKTSFNTVFKKVTGETPSQYARRIMATPDSD